MLLIGLVGWFCASWRAAWIATAGLWILQIIVGLLRAEEARYFPGSPDVTSGVVLNMALGAALLLGMSALRQRRDRKRAELGGTKPPG